MAGFPSLEDSLDVDVDGDVHDVVVPVDVSALIAVAKIRIAEQTWAIITENEALTKALAQDISNWKQKVGNWVPTQAACDSWARVMAATNNTLILLQSYHGFLNSDEMIPRLETMQIQEGIILGFFASIGLVPSSQPAAFPEAPAFGGPGAAASAVDVSALVEGMGRHHLTDVDPSASADAAAGRIAVVFGRPGAAESAVDESAVDVSALVEGMEELGLNLSD